MIDVEPIEGHAKVEYLPDASINAAVDAELRDLLTTCFTKPCDVVFETRRFFREPYPHRWVIRDRDGAMVAHVGVHEKSIRAGGKTFCVGGICEVCVHPEFRERGFVRSMLQVVHSWLEGNAYDFSFLFGKPGVYGSSGYRQRDNIFHDADGDGGTHLQQVSGLVKELSDTPWPRGDVYLPGPKF